LVRRGKNILTSLNMMRLNSLQLHATTTMAMQINYWNLLNSHWEPREFSCTIEFSPLTVLVLVIDPWTFTLTVRLQVAEEVFL
jgi:vacuolar protein sorting-associated protein 13A/C